MISPPKKTLLYETVKQSSVFINIKHLGQALMRMQTSLDVTLLYQTTSGGQESNEAFGAVVWNGKAGGI
jgi:hypothetical protein